MRKIFFVLFFFSIFEINSHEFNPAHLVIDEVDNQNYIYEAIWMYPYKNIGSRGEVIFPNECKTVSNDLYYQGRYLNENITIDCNNSLKGQSIEVINLSVLTDALITINFNDDAFEGLINVQKNTLEIPLEIDY